MSTKKTKEQQLGDRYLPDYPIVYDDYVCDDSMFVDTVRPHNSYLAAIGGDYDGDTVSLRAVFSIEANLEADKLVWSKKNLLDQQGKGLRPLGKEAVIAAFCLTRDPIK